jgi:hypothetical protein
MRRRLGKHRLVSRQDRAARDPVLAVRLLRMPLRCSLVIICCPVAAQIGYDVPVASPRSL